jgi:hypothetical protein
MPAECTTTASRLPCVSTAMCRLRPLIFLPASWDLLDEPSVATNADALTAALHEMEQAQAVADELYERWAELTEKAG